MFTDSNGEFFARFNRRRPVSVTVLLDEFMGRDPVRAVFQPIADLSLVDGLGSALEGRGRLPEALAEYEEQTRTGVG